MKKLQLILLVSLLAFTSGGCGLFGQSGEEKPPEPEKSPSSTKPPEKQAFEPKIPATGGAVYPLIPSTSPNERKQEIEAGRDNPFAVIAIKPVIKSKVATNGVADPKRLCQIEAQPPTNVAQAPSTPPQAPGTPPKSSGAAQAVEPPPLPPPLPPVPNEARGVLVSGVLSLSGTPVAIVQAPGEKVARQVTKGAVLSNGQVLVKGINANVPKPYVVLEQYGVDVARFVGQEPEAPVAPPAPATPKPKTSAAPQAPQAPQAATPAPQAPQAPQAATPAPGPNGFGKVKNLVLLTFNVDEVTGGRGRRTRATGILCNDGYSPIKVGGLVLQVEDKKTNVVVNSLDIGLGTAYRLQSGQKAEFDVSIPNLRGRKLEDVNIKLIDWS